MSLDDFIAGLDRVVDDLQRHTGERLVIAANDVASLVKNRVVQTGKDNSGQPFTPYSTNDVPAYKYIGKSRTGSADTKVRQAAKQGGALSYKQFRELNKLRTDKKNFEFTGSMWRNFGVTKAGQSGGVFSTEIGGQTPDATDKLEFLSNQEGKVISAPSKSEIDLAQKALQTWFENILIKNLS